MRGQGRAARGPTDARGAGLIAQGAALAERLRRLRGGRREPVANAGAVAARAAVLLRGGVPRPRVLEMLAEEDRQVRSWLDSGRGPTPEGRLLAAAWAVAERTGAPFATALERIAEALDQLTALRERREVLLTAPRMSIRLVSALPPLAAALGALLGFDPIGVLLAPAGLPLTAAGVALLVGGIRWAGALAGAVASRDRASGFELILTEIALAGGGPPEQAIRVVADCAADADAEWIDYGALRDDGPVRSVLASAAATGAPAGPMLVAEARAAGARAHAELEREAERLGIRVLIPLGVCVLPAFVALGVLPVVLSMLGGLDLASSTVPPLI